MRLLRQVGDLEGEEMVDGLAVLVEALDGGAYRAVTSLVPSSSTPSVGGRVSVLIKPPGGIAALLSFRLD